MWIVPIVLLALTAAVPLIWGEPQVYRFGVVLIFLVAALGLHILVNWAGEVSLAHAGLFGLPAFAVLAVSSTRGISPVYLLPFGVAIGALTGAVLALPALRSRGLQVALVTLVAGIAIDRFLFTQDWLVGGVPRTAPPVTIGPLEITTSRGLYPFLVLMCVLSVVFVALLYRSKVARGWFWTRANPDAAAAFGIPVVRYRILAYTVSGVLAGLGGALYAIWVPSFGRGAIPTTISFSFLLIVVIGGHGVFRGVAAAAILLQGGEQFTSQIFGTQAAEIIDVLLVYGGPIGLISVITKHPAGLTGLGYELAEKLHLHKRATTQVAPAAEPPHAGGEPAPGGTGPLLSKDAGSVSGGARP